MLLGNPEQRGYAVPARNVEPNVGPVPSFERYACVATITGPAKFEINLFAAATIELRGNNSSDKIMYVVEPIFIFL